MKILFIHHNTALDGSAISLFVILDGLRAKGVELALALPKIPLNEDFREKLESLGIPYFTTNIVQSVADEEKYKVMTLRHRIKFLEDLYKRKIASCIALSKIVKQVKPDIIHTNVGVIHEGYWIAKIYSIPHIFHLREYQEDFGWKILPSKRWFEYILKKSTIITITDGIKCNYELDNYTNAYTIHNGILSKTKTDLRLPKEKFFFCASRISPEKGLDCAITAFGKFYQSHKDYQLIIAGEGPENYNRELKSLADNMGVENSVQFIGQKDLNEVFEYMCRATALLVCSHHEGLGRMTVEASFAGCVVIGRNSSGTKEILDKTGGFVFDDDAEIPTLMDRLIQLPIEEYKQRVLKAQRIAVKDFSTEQYIDRIYDLYNTILK